jgi:hypothetical protein
MVCTHRTCVLHRNLLVFSRDRFGKRFGTSIETFPLCVSVSESMPHGCVSQIMWSQMASSNMHTLRVACVFVFDTKAFRCHLGHADSQARQKCQAPQQARCASEEPRKKNIVEVDAFIFVTPSGLRKWKVSVRVDRLQCACHGENVIHMQSIVCHAHPNMGQSMSCEFHTHAWGM